MKKDIVNLLVACFLILLFLASAFAEDLRWENIGGEISEVNVVSFDRLNPKYLYLGTRRGVFKSEDGGGRWRPITSLNKNINFLLQDNQGVVYAATINGLFLTSNQGRNWQRVFRGKNSEENNCKTLAILNQGQIYLGTDSGLFISKDKGRTWHKQRGELGNIPISSIAKDSLNNIIYVVATNRVFKIKEGLDSYAVIFTAGRSNIDNNENREGEGIEEPSVTPKLKHIAVDSNAPNRVYLASESGVYVSQDCGLTWNSASSAGLLSKDIKFILLSPHSQIYTVTKSGIFLYKNERWQELSLRLVTEDIRSLAMDEQNTLYAATDKGIFRARQDELFMGIQEGYEESKDEPGIRELHEAAIKYAQVIDPRRIENLRRQAKLKAILPEFRLDYDKTVTSYSNSTITRFDVGPSDWSVSLKWNLSDLIWSEQQRLIDSQVRLMIELRNDILDEINKIYFERRKVKIELAYLSFQDSKKISEKKLRLEELTASLDALTGGYFSQHLKD